MLLCGQGGAPVFNKPRRLEHAIFNEPVFFDQRRSMPAGEVLTVEQRRKTLRRNVEPGRLNLLDKDVAELDGAGVPLTGAGVLQVAMLLEAELFRLCTEEPLGVFIVVDHDLAVKLG